MNRDHYVDCGMPVPPPTTARFDEVPATGTWKEFLLDSIRVFKYELVIAALLAVYSVKMQHVTPGLHAPLSDEQWAVHMHPMAPVSTIPFWWVQLFGSGATVFCLMVSRYLNAKYSEFAFRQTMVTYGMFMLLSVLSTLAITDTFKTLSGRLRPDYVARCFEEIFDPTVWPPVPFNVVRGFYVTCPHARSAEIALEGRRSMPSGHASMAATAGASSAMFLFTVWRKTIQNRKTRLVRLLPEEAQRLTLATRGKMHKKNFITTMNGVVIALCLIMALVLPVLVGISRITDRRHFPTDVFAGLFLGYLVSFGYGHYFCFEIKEFF